MRRPALGLSTAAGTAAGALTGLWIAPHLDGHHVADFVALLASCLAAGMTVGFLHARFGSPTR